MPIVASARGANISSIAGYSYGNPVVDRRFRRVRTSAGARRDSAQAMDGNSAVVVEPFSSLTRYAIASYSGNVRNSWKFFVSDISSKIFAACS